MTVVDTARAHQAERADVAAAAVERAFALWSTLEVARLSESFDDGVGDRLFVQVSVAQLTAASSADPFVSLALADQGASTAAVGVTVPRALAGVASDGRDLTSLLYQPVITAKRQIAGGLSPAAAFEVGRAELGMIVGTQVADAGRVADAVATVARPAATGYVRVLSPPSCGRCAVLAGRVYRSNADFLRHPRCDCTSAPAVGGAADAVRTDPKAYFESLSGAEQDRYFTSAGARAIREGADVGQVVNARRGASGLSSAGRLTAAERAALDGPGPRRLGRVDAYGREVFITREGARPGGRGAARSPRLMPESIFEIAGDDRAEAQRLLRQFGYIT